MKDERTFEMRHNHIVNMLVGNTDERQQGIGMAILLACEYLETISGNLEQMSYRVSFPRQVINKEKQE